MKLYETSVKRPIAVVMAVLIFFVMGLYSMTKLSIDMMPDMTMPMIGVITQYTGVAPTEIENLVTIPIENSISTVNGIKTTRSSSSEGSSMVVAEFNTSVDIDIAAQDTKEKIDMLKSYLPDDCDAPMVVKFDPSMMPVAYFSFSMQGEDLAKTKKFVEDELSKKLESIDGVASVDVSGGTEREIQVEVDTNKLFGYNLSLDQIVSAIMTENRNTPGGTVTGSGKNLAVRSIGKFTELKDLEYVPIKTMTGQIIYLKDVARVIDGYTEVQSYARLNGEDSLSVSVQKQSGANTVDVVSKIIKTLDDFKTQNPNIEYEMTMEQASYIQNAISSVSESAVYGAVFAILILFLFLSSLRSSFIIGITMPVSIFTTFIGMYFAGMTLNVVSLGGLALGVGMLVDNAVVVLENIFRRRVNCKEDSITAAIKGSKEVVGAVIASVLTTCIVYVPILFVDGITAVIFKQLAFTIIFSQIASLLTTFLLIPMLSAKVTEVNSKNKFKSVLLKPFNLLLSGLYKGYNRLIRTSLKHRAIVVTIVLGLFVVSVVALGKIGMELMPASDEGMLSVNVSLPQGSELEDTNQLTQKIEERVKQNEYVASVFATISGSGMMGGGSQNTSSVQVTLVDKKDRKVNTNDVVEMLREDLSSIAGAEIKVEASSSTSMSGGSAGVSFALTGDDLDNLEQYANQAVEVLKSIEGVREATTSMSDTKPEARVYIDRQKAAQYGLTTASAATLIKANLTGQVATQFTDTGKEYDVRVKLPNVYTETYQDLKNMKLKAGTGQWITIEDIADLKMEQGYTTINRDDQKRIVTVSSQVYGTDIGSVTNQFYEKMKSVTPPEGCSFKADGSYEMMMDSFVSLAGAIVLGLLLMYMVMAAQFESLIQPLIVMGAVPMALIGVVLALVLDGSPLNIISCIGMLMLCGMIVNNAIILIDFINTTIKEGAIKDRTEIVVNAGMTRMRPVLMTTLTSILGFLPLVVSSAEGSEMMRPLAVVLLGGLAIGTVLTLIFVPVIYTIADDKKLKKQAKKQAKLAKKLEKKNKSISTEG